MIDTLNDREQSVPYIHIFALIGYLKQLCDHPCLVLGEREGGAVGSAKWDLFCELLAECIESEQKVVVFSQYLGMIEMISRHLQSLDIDHEVLTGSSTNRGQRVRRFQEDESCRVFVGSLKAGGVGVDLTAASAVIHYDRWWNAAVEDQASDRVHRMGQDKAVQVFRLLTRESIEERIDAIITRKRSLSESILPEDSATALKSFSREELLEILRG